MYNKSKKSKQVLALRESIKEINQLSKIIDKYQDGEEMIAAIGKFLKGISGVVISNTKIVELSREYCCREMNLVCYAQEIFEEKKRIEKKRKNLKDEIGVFSQVLKDLDSIIASGKLSIEKREDLIRVIKGKKFVEFNEEFGEVVKNVKMLCSTEIDVEEARQLFSFVSLHLKNLLKFLR